MKKAIIFDMDGVLIDSYEAWFQLFNGTLKNFGLKEVSKKEFDEGAWAQDFDTVTERFFKGKKVEEISKFYDSNFERFWKHLKKIKNAEFLLKKLSEKKIKKVVVSNSFNDIANHLLKAVGLRDYFDLVIGGDDVENGKPAPDMVFLGCKRLKVDVKDVILVGDTECDRIAAEKARCFFVGYKTDGDERIEDLKELLEMV